MSDAYDSELLEVPLCTSLDVPPEKFVDAAIAAINENPDNAPVRQPPSGVGHGPGGPLELALTTEKRWKPGRTVSVRFLDGVASVQDKVKAYAKEWEQHANIKLDFVNAAESDLRISFQESGSWSYVGTDNLVIDEPEATMNYGWLDSNSKEQEYSRVVLHEFGHALGAIHEHQNPAAGIPWDEDKVYQYYQATQGWSQQQTFHNVLRRHDASQTNFTEFDPTSIMQYAVPNALTIGDFEIGWNSLLSSIDKQFMGTMYPAKGPEARVLGVGETVDAEIGEPGEEDHYRFTMDSEREVTLETSGRTDVVLALFGPDDRTRLLASDDDSGTGLNARLRLDLVPGEYFVRIRHYSERRGGPYSVKLSA